MDPQLSDAGLASFDVCFDLPSGDVSLAEVAQAVRMEYRDGSRWKRLTCDRVSLYSERERGTVYILHVGQSVEFDWTWEGAVAFCPQAIEEFGMLSDEAMEDTLYDDRIVWSGEILEVDEQNGCLFISGDTSDRPPTTGSFLVRPFEFLSVLDAVYNSSEFESSRQQMLRPRLSATLGDVHPRIEARPSDQALQTTSGLEELSPWWQHRWCVLWGPPGTGKTYTSGRQIASIANADPTERILVVSTTNKATDAIAASIGEHGRQFNPDLLENGKLLRIGQGASFHTFAQRRLQAMLHGAQSAELMQLDRLASQLSQADSMEDKALLRKQIANLKAGGGNGGSVFVNPHVQVVVATAFKAMSMLRTGTVRSLAEKQRAPFSTIVIDEAGLISRAAVAALSLLAAKRVVLVGDSKQLAPISRISRVMPTRKKRWLASSGISHLNNLHETSTAVHVLRQQHRMHPVICNMVSKFQYQGGLSTASDRKSKASNLPASLDEFSRAIWYRLDADFGQIESIRAGRGPGNQSWVRNASFEVLEKFLKEPGIRNARGFFVSPFKAQAKRAAELFTKWKLPNWEASTVHRQQGSEADIVLFDTVNAGSASWPFEEWQRLINVAISRAREAVVVISSDAEMDEPYLKPLTSWLTPAILEKAGAGWKWKSAVAANASAIAETKTTYPIKSVGSNSASNSASDLVGKQLEARRRLQPVLSDEQQRLSNLKLDGKPRLVRGVAGSGKSVVLCNWLARTVSRLQPTSEERVWAVYANRSLHQLLRRSIESAWQRQHQEQLFEHRPFPWQQVSLMHIKDVLAGILPERALSMARFGFDYDRAAEEFLNCQSGDALQPRCQALFIDEAQDLGPSTLRLLLSLVESSDLADANSRSAHIFYDNAQNIYDCKTPTWSQFGIDMRGRSTIMRESFRGTRPIAELAINVLDQLSDTTGADQEELLKLNLLVESQRNGRRWLEVKFNQIDGPKPVFQTFDHRREEIEHVATHIRRLTQSESVLPRDITILYNGKKLASELLNQLAPRLATLGIELSQQTNQAFQRRDNTIVMTTANSFKGYESEVIMIPGVDQFVSSEGKLLANSLYVAMTRAQSLLLMYGSCGSSAPSRKIYSAIESCLSSLQG